MVYHFIIQYDSKAIKGSNIEIRLLLSYENFQLVQTFLENTQLEQQALVSSSTYTMIINKKLYYYEKSRKEVTLDIRDSIMPRHKFIAEALKEETPRYRTTNCDSR